MKKNIKYSKASPKFHRHDFVPLWTASGVALREAGKIISTAEIQGIFKQGIWGNGLSSRCEAIADKQF